jgi:hypothetical protein
MKNYEKLVYELKKENLIHHYTIYKFYINYYYYYYYYGI